MNQCRVNAELSPAFFMIRWFAKLYQAMHSVTEMSEG
jgi:hypothetical protein